MTDAADARQGGLRLPEIRVPGALTLAGLIAGLLAGLALSGTPAGSRVLAVTGPIGDLWLRGLQMTIMPLVAGLLFTGIVETVAAAHAGAMARRTLAWIIGLLAFSATWGGLGMSALLKLSPAPAGIAPAGSTPDQPLPGLGDFLSAFVPSNVFTAAAADALLPVIVFTSLFAIASTRLAAPQRRQLAVLFEALAGAMLVVIGWVLWLAPIGVFCLGLSLTARTGSAVIGALAHYIVLVSLLGLFLVIGGYAMAAIAARKPLARYARAVFPAQVVAISTQSSLACVPPMLASSLKLGVRPATAEFVLPLAVTIFRATSPAMNMGVVIYAASLAGIDVTPAMMATGILVAFLVSFGSVSLPGTISFIASTGPIAAAMGIPLWPLGVLVAVEMLPDIVRTVGNVSMDVALAATVDAGIADEDEDGASSTPAESS